MPTADALTEYYSNYFEPFAPGLTHDSPPRFTRNIASFIREPNKKLGIADFGGGDVMLAYSRARILCDRGCSSAEISVVDYAEPLISQVPRIMMLPGCSGPSIPPSDIILASGVLEHIPSLSLHLMQIFAGLNPSGVYIRTPPWQVL